MRGWPVETAACKVGGVRVDGSKAKERGEEKRSGEGQSKRSEYLLVGDASMADILCRWRQPVDYTRAFTSERNACLFMFVEHLACSRLLSSFCVFSSSRLVPHQLE